MADNNLIKFPAGRQGIRSRAEQRDRALTLFGERGKHRGKIAFVDIGILTEDLLLKIVTRNAITSVIDIRSKPIFTKPYFNHKRILAYFYSRNIYYVEYMFLTINQDRDRISSNIGRKSADTALNNALSLGLSLAIYDTNSSSIDLTEDFRRRLSRLSEYVTEVHPRSLLSRLL